jgi:hypothetical protein
VLRSCQRIAPNRTKSMSRLATTILICGLLTVACTSVEHVSSSQNVMIETPQAEGATCTLSTPRGTWQVDRTPGMASVIRGPGALSVHCTKDQFAAANVTAEATPRGMPWQNVVSGGFFGQRAADASDTAYEYPASVSIPMQPDPKARLRLEPAAAPASTPPPAVTHTPVAPAPFLPPPAEKAPIEISKPQFPVRAPPPAARPPTRFTPSSPGGGAARSVARAPAAPARASSTQLSSRLVGLRVGSHDGYVRVVLDFNAKTTYSTGFDRDGHVLIRLPAASSEAKRRRYGPKQSPISAITTGLSATGSGSTVTIETRRPVSSKAFDLVPDDVGGHRIVIDLEPIPPLEN